MVRTLQALAAGAIFLLMSVVAVDVIGRYVFNRPLPAGYELIQGLMALLVFATLPLVSRHDQHISLGLFEQLFPSSGNGRLRIVAVHAFSSAVLAFVTWRIVEHAIKLAAAHDTTPVLGIPLAPLACFMAAMTGLSAALLLRLAFHCFSQRRPS